ncbi:MAG: DUF262 domain-containing protein, partial [Trebonia sp.]
LGVEGYVSKARGAMDLFLEQATAMLDSPEETTDARLEELYEEFRRAMVNCYAVFGQHAFRKWPEGTERLYPINRPLFESWSCALSQYNTDDLARRKDDIVSLAREHMTSDRNYNDAITSSTGGVPKVRLRFEIAAEVARAGL